VLKGSYTAISVSVIVHILLLLALILGSEKSPKLTTKDTPKVRVIKSFLYTSPKKTPEKSVPQKAQLENVITENKPPQKADSKKLAPNKITTKQAATNKPTESKPLSTQVTNAVKSDTVTTKNKVAGKSRGGFSSYDRLSRLRKKLETQQRDEAFAELTQKRSASIMDGEPFPVPKTTVPLTREQKHKLNTSNSHVGSITKNDNGTCTIYREQILGSPVEATTSSFACGESKFDKSFREHMQKVQAKLGQ